METIGNCTLILADAREWVASLPEDFHVDAVVTDPPYGVAFSGKTNRDSDDHHASLMYPDTPDYVDQLIRDAIVPALSHASRAAIFSGTRMMFRYPDPMAVGGVVCPSGKGIDRWGFGCFHPILYYGNCPYLHTGAGARPNAFVYYGRTERDIDHPCPKPLAWMSWAVNRVSLMGETILDLFAGSGTTGVACVHANRKFIGVEIAPQYFDIACERISAAAAQGRLLA